jgi:hypothetical protein
MSRIPMAFKLRELYAIKHALRKLVENRRQELEAIDKSNKDNLNTIWRIDNDITHEERIIDYITEVIDKVIYK